MLYGTRSRLLSNMCMRLGRNLDDATKDYVECKTRLDTQNGQIEKWKKDFKDNDAFITKRIFNSLCSTYLGNRNPKTLGVLIVPDTNVLIQYGGNVNGLNTILHNFNATLFIPQEMASEMDLLKKGTNSKLIRPILKFASEYPKKVIIQSQDDVVQCQDFHDAQFGPQRADNSFIKSLMYLASSLEMSNEIIAASNDNIVHGQLSNVSYAYPNNFHYVNRATSSTQDALDSLFDMLNYEIQSEYALKSKSKV